MIPTFFFLFPVNIAFLAGGMHYGWPSSTIPLLTSGNYTFQISDSAGSWLVSMLPMGAFVGDIIAGLLINIIGRKKLLLFTTLPFSMCWLLIGLAPSAPYMFVGRFIAGMFDGIIYSVAPPYLAEISDPEIRGLIGCTYSLTLVVGILLMSMIEYWLSMQISCYIGAAIMLSTYLIVPWIPESPYFYLMKSNENAATKSLQKLTGKDDVSDDIKRIHIGLLEEHCADSTIVDLCKNSINFKAVLLSVFLCGSQQLSGITAITSYSTTVFDESKDIMDPFAANLIYFTMVLLGSITTLLLIDHFGRKKLLIFSYVLTTICLAINSSYLTIPSYRTETLHLIPLINMLIYAFVYSVGVNTVPMLIISEIWPAHLRAVGLCISNFAFSLCSTVAINYFTWSSDNFGRPAPFFTFMILSVIFVIMVWKFVPETKEKTLEEIQSQMRGKKQNSKSSPLA